MENDMSFQNGHRNQKAIDPVGVEFLLGIISTLVTVVAALHQFGYFSRKHKDLLEEFESIHHEIIRLQNTLDDFVLLVHRYVSQSDNCEIEDNHLTISDTMMWLKEREYYRWLDLHDAIKRLDQKIYSVISKIRLLAQRYRLIHPSEPFDTELLHSFDELILSMGKATFSEFIKNIRDLTQRLSNRLAELVFHEKRQ